MRFSLSPVSGKSARNAFLAVLLASTVTSCSSDASRFGGLFSRNESDQITTGSVSSAPSRLEPVSAGRVSRTSLNSLSANSDFGGSSLPQRSSARLASSPASIQRAELGEPGPVPAARSSHMPTQQAAASPRANAQTESFGDEPVKAEGWSSQNAPSVTLKAGETVTTLARRYGVPEKEILRANGFKNAAAAKPGQTILIPTFNGGNAAKSAAKAADFSEDNNLPKPTNGQDEVAVLPNGAGQRNKFQDDSSSNGKKMPVGAGGDDPDASDGYVVKQGDSLAKIAKATGTDIDDLKAANNLSANSLRIGQTLKIPVRGAADQASTGSITAKQNNVSTKAENAAPTVEAAPVAKQTVNDVEQKTDVASATPASTGIGKFRWPVRGAIIAGFGTNVGGSRNDGIDISVPQGTPVKAAENGVVIYAGNGLKELGNTVLVRHDDGTVTVYGNADKISVTRGQKIQRGQTVATSGISGNAKQPQLHFEVRKNASPVNPATFLE